MVPERSRLEKALGYSFSDPALLELALSHRSVGANNNERLEFLGDSVLNHIVAEHLFRSFPDSSEGELSRMRIALVRGEALAAVARELDLGSHLLLGAEQKQSGVQRRASVLADALEAVVGAILLDGGQEAAQRCVAEWFQQRLAAVKPGSVAKDSKTALQEYLQGRGLPLPEYHLAAVEGEDHCQLFTVECCLGDSRGRFSGRGSSRRRAEQAAAGAALEALSG